MTLAHTQITRRDLVSADTRTRLTMFASQFLGSFYSLQRPKLVELGEQDTTSALDYKVPVALGESNWTRWVNGIKYRDVGELMLSVLVGDWSDGVKAEYKKLQSDAWANYGWGRQPERMAIGASLIGVKLLAALIEAGETTASIENNLDGDTSSTAIKIFGQGKTVDPMGRSSAIYSNLFTSTGTTALGNTDKAAPMTLTNIDRVWQHIRTVKSQNGNDFRDLKWKYTLVHPADELKARRYFEEQGSANDNITEGASGDATISGSADQFKRPNTAKQHKIEVISVPYFSAANAGIWYPVCTTDESPLCPWLTLTQIPANEVPLAGNFPSPPQNANPLVPGFEWILDYLDSQMYKHGIPGVAPAGTVAIAAKRSQGVAITEPWRIFKCKGT